ncbi:MAG: P44/Msp2 family outer membrane protein, partial [Pseudomonadota bacterium]
AGTRTELEYKYIAPNVDLTRETGGFNSVTGGSEGVAVTPPDDFRAHFLMANAYVDVFRSGSTALFLGAGVGGGFFNNGFDQTDAAFAYQGRTGISVDVSDSITLMAEYVYLRTLEMKFGPSAFSAENTVTDPRVVGEPFVMSNVGVSVLFKF